MKKGEFTFVWPFSVSFFNPSVFKNTKYSRGYDHCSKYCQCPSWEIIQKFIYTYKNSVCLPLLFSRTIVKTLTSNVCAAVSCPSIIHMYSYWQDTVRVTLLSIIHNHLSLNSRRAPWRDICVLVASWFPQNQKITSCWRSCHGSWCCSISANQTSERLQIVTRLSPVCFLFHWTFRCK